MSLAGNDEHECPLRMGSELETRTPACIPARQIAMSKPRTQARRAVQDAALPPPLLREAYHELVHIIWRLYRVCKLVHGDLSEYNVLWHNRAIVVIDVSQSVDLDHPKALDFLREDCAHVNGFFKRVGVPTLTTRELFDLVTDPLVTAGNLDAVVDALKQARTAPALLPLTSFSLSPP
jgi:serine/threonine-protein kinase RIO1